MMPLYEGHTETLVTKTVDFVCTICAAKLREQVLMKRLPNSAYLFSSQCNLASVRTVLCIRAICYNITKITGFKCFIKCVVLVVIYNYDQ